MKANLFRLLFPDQNSASAKLGAKVLTDLDEDIFKSLLQYNVEIVGSEAKEIKPSLLR